jgi:AcrR family transcriptional regulator
MARVARVVEQAHARKQQEGDEGRRQRVEVDGHGWVRCRVIRQRGGDYVNTEHIIAFYVIVVNIRGMAEHRYHHGNLHAALLQIGLSAAKTGGPAALQLRELAAAAGVSPSAVYRHFPDMAHLTAEVSRSARESLAAAMLGAASLVIEEPGDSGIGAIRRLHAIGRAYIAFAEREPQLFDTAFMASGAAPSCADDPSAWGVLEGALDDLVATGELDASRSYSAPLIAWSAVHGMSGVLVRGMLPGPYQAEEAIEATLRGVREALGLRHPVELR